MRNWYVLQPPPHVQLAAICTHVPVYLLIKPLLLFKSCFSLHVFDIDDDFHRDLEPLY